MTTCASAPFILSTKKKKCILLCNWLFPILALFKLITYQKNTLKFSLQKSSISSGLIEFEFSSPFENYALLELF